MSAKDIMHHSKPAIVRIEVGQDRVGTGFILDRTGLVATNLHVVAAAADITVKIKDGEKYKEYAVQSIAGYDQKHDLAVLKIAPQQPLPTLTLGDSDRMEAGDAVYAIGNPLGMFDYSISDGLVSAKRDACEGLPKEECSDFTFFQFTAPISQGSSGGPLFNQSGEVIGITTAIVTGGQNINFAVPANYLKRLVKAAPRMQAPAEFAIETKELVASHGEGKGDGNEAPLPKREVPEHETTIWDGCKLSDVEVTVIEISRAIERGAPEYNKRTPEGFENCYRIYEGVSLKVKSKIPCKGVVKAFDDGLARAEKIATYRDKAWALRDTFDGLIKVADKWCRVDPSCKQKAQP